jgi:hypothetical protein
MSSPPLARSGAVRGLSTRFGLELADVDAKPIEVIQRRRARPSGRGLAQRATMLSIQGTSAGGVACTRAVHSSSVRRLKSRVTSS